MNPPREPSRSFDEPRTDFSKSDALRKKGHAMIPAACHTYAKGDDQFPVLSPGFIVRGSGSHVWDVDGNEYIEYGMGCRAVTLGHAYGPVVEAARRTMELGQNFTRPAAIEVECAEAMLDLIHGAEMVKFTKDGSSATTAAVKLARAHTGRDKIAFCSDHPFFSTDDWFIGATPMNAGIPKVIQDLSLTFRYKDLDGIRELFAQHPGEIAGLILEPTKGEDPGDFLHQAMQICHDNGALFILDEMITGFRYHEGGAQRLYDIVPDLSTFGKAMGNGFAVSALAGKREFMRLGGLDHDRERVFLLSTTHGAETHALAAAIETMKIYQREPVVETLARQGARLKAGLDEVIAARGLERFVQIEGHPCNLVFAALDPAGERSQSFRTLLMQELIKGGVLGPSLVISYAHTDDDLDCTIRVFDRALEVYGRALEEGVETYLVGRPSNVVWRRFN